MRLQYNLSKISHRFRIFLLLEFTIVTGSQFVTLFQTTAYHGIITCVNGGDFAVSSIVQVVGVILCLNAASKISHRAQGIGSLASRWHALATCSSGEASQTRNTNGNLEATNAPSSFYRMSSESDLESVDFMMMPTNTQLASSMTSYQKRQSLVMYLQSNRGGITIYGWTVDRGLINTIFFIELWLILFVLGKTIVFTGA
nr:Neuropeptides B/W receptor type like [Ipomoea batatas]GMD11196.1 Neuropeptides B/W receptor type like [Ipomoea batatas]